MMVAEDNIERNFNNAFKNFLEMVTNDPRLGPLHISLYVSILYFYNEGERKAPVSIFSKLLMKYAKISSHDTYHRYIRQLHQYGYIYYIPSFNPILGSLIYPLKLEKK